jgi:hypothetical protein
MSFGPAEAWLPLTTSEQFRLEQTLIEPSGFPTIGLQDDESRLIKRMEALQ